MKQTARRSAPFAIHSRNPAPQARTPWRDAYDDELGDDINSDNYDDANDDDDWDDDDPPPPYPESDDDMDTYGEDVTLAPLGYINGRYTIICPSVSEDWPQYDSDYDLVFAISGSKLWATFDMGVME